AEQLDTGHLGHALVAEHEVDLAVTEDLQRLGARVGGVDLEHVAEALLERIEDAPLVIDDEQREDLLVLLADRAGLLEFLPTHAIPRFSLSNRSAGPRGREDSACRAGRFRAWVLTVSLLYHRPRRVRSG